MKNHTTIYRVLFGSFCVGLCSAPAVASGDLATDGARLTLNQPEEVALEEPASADRWLLSGWTGSFEFGLTGASGNNDRFNVRAMAAASRESDSSADQVTLLYTYAKDEGTQTENRLDATARHDWKFADSPWRVYLGASYEYDEFQDWDHRLSVGPGVGYQAIDDDRTNLLLRAGVVATREFGGSDDSWTPELNLGLDLAHQLTERQSLTARFDFYPSIDELSQYRFEADAAWKIDIDPEANLFLKIGVEDRYDSTPGPSKKRNDISYYATVGWSF
jgi:putative salt-induced outer membrane protein YdiY